MEFMFPQLRLISGAVMPTVGLGTFKITKENLNAALECGYRHIDTAYSYGTEKIIGEVLKDWFSTGKIKREDLFITTKLPTIGNRKADVQRFLQHSLKALGISHVDLYLIHLPFCFKAEDDVTLFPMNDGKLNWDHLDIEGVWSSMERMVDIGLANSIGVSNFNSEQILRIIKSGRIQPSVLQVEAHLYFQQHKLKQLCESHGIKMVAFSPLGAPYMRPQFENLAIVLEEPVLQQIARVKNKTTAQIALKYLLEIGFVIIPKPDNFDQARENLQLFDFNLNTEELAQLKRLDRGTEGRIFDWKFKFAGCEDSNEYPFHIPF